MEFINGSVLSAVGHEYQNKRLQKAIKEMSEAKEQKEMDFDSPMIHQYQDEPRFYKGPKIEVNVQPASDITYTYTPEKTPLEKQVGGQHYKDMAIQPVEFILANELGFCEGNIIKYTCRYKQKGGIEDLRKVIHYAELLINKMEK